MTREVLGLQLTTMALGQARPALKVKKIKKANHLKEVTRVPPMKKKGMVKLELTIL